jgi:integrase
MTLGDINSRQCASYVASRGSVSMARRELEDLRAAINLHRKEGLHNQIVTVTLPAKARSRQRWLTRSEAARLIWAAWRFRQSNTGVATRKHIARFILVALYTGTRSAAILGASFERIPGRGFADLDLGIFYRLPDGAAETSKRRPTIRIPRRLLAHMRRWRANGHRHLVEFNTKPIESIGLTFEAVADAAGLRDVTPHILRHTAASWLMQSGADQFRVGGFLGMTAQTLAGYAHHRADHLDGVGELLTQAGRLGNVSATLRGSNREQTPSNVDGLSRKSQ